ncbi:extracellular solute-binding protein [Clostridium cibarium]|uniref:Extracellular solute-binding protein n=1 Tax=Clostridium cibarium TaxID=2762247 RepID=A0ABR8PRF6_9CLOT|nr:extracellular solute-binding protein [Clostridium cibarium]MBD7910761.1 extracellular solute-binding protein [Clostridium cibarium]
MKSKKISLILVGLMSLTMLAGCGSKDAKDSSGDKHISIMAPLVGTDAPAGDNEIQKQLEEKTGYKVDITWVPDSSYNDKLSITLASDEVPDILVVKDKDATTISNVNKGAFWKLDDFIEDYDNLSKADESIKENASFNGSTYGIYRTRDVIRSCVAIRKDWLNNLGLKEPKTLEEFTDMLKKFTNNDPDKNGKKDTYGMVIPKWPGSLNTNSPFDQMSIWFGAPNATKVDDGKVTPDFMTDEYMNALDYFKKLYDEGLMNKDFAVMDSKNWDDPFVNGQAGVIVDVQSRALDKLQKKILEKYGDDGKNGDSYVTMVGNITTSAADKILPTTGYSGMLVLPKQSVKSEKDVKKVLDFINKTNTEEVNTILNNGVEGVHYKMENGKYVPTTDKTLKAQLDAYSQLSTNTPNYKIMKPLKGNNLEAQRNDIMEKGKDKAVFNPTASLISDVYSKKGAQLQNIMADARIKYIAGQIDKKGYQDAINLWLSTGGQEYMDELGKLYKENIK